MTDDDRTTDAGQGAGAPDPITPQDPPAPPSMQELRDRASELHIAGRSKMTREELEAAIAEAQAVTRLRTPFARAMDAQAARARLEHAGALDPSAADAAGREDLVEVAQQRAKTRTRRASA